MKMSLYELAANYQALMEVEIDQETLETALESLDEQFEQKIENIGLVIKSLKAEADTIKAEEQRLNALRKIRENRIESLKRYAESAMIATGNKKIKGVLCSANIQKNAPSLAVVSEDSIPDSYYILQDPKLDKKQLLADLKAGTEIEGVSIKQTESIRFRQGVYQMKFRELKAEEIDVRVQSVKRKGAVLLLYKDARADMIILDETVGCMNWKREHTRDNHNCVVSLWDDKKEQWVPKEDTGTESFTEKEKGLASDSFKRACFNWGIGRELYTSPFIWVNANDMQINEKNGKYSTYDKFEVEKITYKEGRIDGLAIKNSKTGKRVFTQSPKGQEGSIYMLKQWTGRERDVAETLFKSADHAIQIFKTEKRAIEADLESQRRGL